MVCVTALGVRGAIPILNPDMRRYGGNTTCFLLDLDGHTLLLDGGSGVLNAPLNGDCDILLSHTHLDHIIGLTFWKGLQVPGRNVHIRTKERGGLGAKAQLTRLMQPPVWPFTPDAYKANVTFSEIIPLQPFSLFEGMSVKTIPSNHPCEGTCFIITYDGIRISYLVDYEHGGEFDGAILEEVSGSDLLIYDGMFCDAEYRADIGHATWQQGVRTATECGVKRTVFTHHHPDRTDDEMDVFARELSGMGVNACFAKEGERYVVRD